MHAKQLADALRLMAQGCRIVNQNDRLKAAADRLERMENALQQLSACNLTEENCANLDVANRRIRNIATLALK
jgi:hypothetical protein